MTGDSAGMTLRESTRTSTRILVLEPRFPARPPRNCKHSANPQPRVGGLTLAFPLVSPFAHQTAPSRILYRDTFLINTELTTGNELSKVRTMHLFFVCVFTKISISNHPGSTPSFGEPVTSTGNARCVPYLRLSDGRKS